LRFITMNGANARSVTCAGCNRKFMSDAALQQHIRDRKDAAHDKISAEGDKAPKKVVRAKSIESTPKVITQTLTASQLLM
jgi:hypothetical protein